MNALAAWICLALIAATQDDAAPEAIVRDLEHDDIVRREAASLRLIEMGGRAVPALEETARRAPPEARARAGEALRIIAREDRLRNAFTEPPDLSLRCEGTPLADALAAVSLRSGFSLAVAGALGERPVRYAQDGGTFLQALDGLCAAAGDLEWRATSDNVVILRRGEPPAGPFVYASRFRIGLPRIDVFRTLREGRSRALVCLYPEVLSERKVRPSAPPRITVEEVLDEGGKPLVPDEGSWIRAIIPEELPPGLPREDISTTPFPLVFRAGSPDLRRLSVVRGRIDLSFVIETIPVDLSDIPNRVPLVRGGWEIRVQAPRSGLLQITVESRAGERVPPEILDLASLRIRDHEAREHLIPYPQLAEIRTVQPRPGVLHAIVLFDPSGQAWVDSVSFNLVQESYQKSVPFRFTDVPLP